MVLNIDVLRKCKFTDISIYRFIKYSSSSTMNSNNDLNIATDVLRHVRWYRTHILLNFGTIDTLALHTSIDFKMDYKQRYEKLKRRVKYFVLENGSLVDEVCILQAELVAARSERLTLIEKLMFYEGLDRNPNSANSMFNESRNSVKNNVGERQSSVVKKSNENETREISKQNQRSTSIFPLKLSNILIHSIGEIIPTNPNFHTAEWIYPVGYVATRIYAHPKDPYKKCVYTCKILNNAGVPQFQLIPDNDLDGVFFGATANICHQELLNAIHASIGKPAKVLLKAKGEIFFGLSNPRVQSLLTLDTKFKLCTKFKGYLSDNGSMCDTTDPTISFAELQNCLTR